MEKYGLMCCIYNLELKIDECNSLIVKNTEKVLNLENALDKVGEYRSQVEENLMRRYASFSELQNAKSKKVIGLAEHLKKYCSNQNISGIMIKFDNMKKSIQNKIEELNSLNSQLRNDIYYYENEIICCRNQIIAIDSETE